VASGGDDEGGREISRCAGRPFAGAKGKKNSACFARNDRCADGAFGGHCAHEGTIHSATLRTGCIVPPQGEKDGEINLAATDGERREGAVVLHPYKGLGEKAAALLTTS